MAKILDRTTGKILAEGNMELKELVMHCIENKINLSDAELQGANLSNIDLSRAYLYRANMQGANLSNTNLTGSDISFANFKGAYLYSTNLREVYASCTDFREAHLIDVDMTNGDFTEANFTRAEVLNVEMKGSTITNADFRHAVMHNSSFSGAYIKEVRIKKAMFFTGLYKYGAMAVIEENGTKWVRLGCHFRTVVDWEHHFWNNDVEFPDDGSQESKLRLFAFETCKRWLELEKNINL